MEGAEGFAKLACVQADAAAGGAHGASGGKALAMRFQRETLQCSAAALVSDKTRYVYSDPNCRHAAARVHRVLRAV